VEFDRLGGLRGTPWIPKVAYRREESPGRAPKLCTDHDIKPFLCGLVMCILLVVVCHVISVLLSYSSVYI